ncbi:hypothetical protein L6452_01502 [Arctium lappa]|uniref:Uncharacterized protein n=1 Tax=Arctium lappa TaxID=4217 RepID=A0ACB9FGU1_ARCLA|nr:hypothetical protein L6452_01502 [Arctium lappa]
MVLTRSTPSATTPIGTSKLWRFESCQNLQLASGQKCEKDVITRTSHLGCQTGALFIIQVNDNRKIRETKKTLKIKNSEEQGTVLRFDL